MAVKTLGILLGYGPRVVFRLEGLGRYLGAFIGAASQRGDLKVVIVAPSWSRVPLRDLLEAEGVPGSAYEIVGPTRLPSSLRFFIWATRSRPRRHPRADRAWLLRALRWALQPVDLLIRTILTARDPIRPILSALALGAGAVVVAVPLLLVVALLIVSKVRLPRRGWLTLRLPRQAQRALVRFKKSVLRAYRRFMRHSYAEMMAAEFALIAAVANQRGDVRSWYVPTALWPEFSAIKRPQLICVPDVVIQEFPVGFSAGDGMVQALHRINDAISGGRHFVTYSETVKQSVLVSGRAVPAEAVHVILHAANSLASRVEVQGFDASDSASRSLSIALASEGLVTSSGPSVGSPYLHATFSFLFYASQFRPSKNVLTLLRAYEYLLRQRYIGHKLVLTGNGTNPEVSAFIRQHGLERDVLCLHGLSEQQLAAYYKLAELAVNPSLSEGGMPFTFAEAVSVGTPAVMANIAVTREIITDPVLAADTLFDPYDWRSLADKVEWALNNRRALYASQRAFYDEVLSKRTWDDVVGEHLHILDAIAGTAVS